MGTSSRSTYRLSAEQVEAARDQRQSTRVGYGSGVPVAAPAAGQSPRDTQFYMVETRDISQTGLSFYADRVPDSESLVLMMGSERQPLYLSAVVVRCRKAIDDPQERYIIGCEFLGEI